MFEKDEKKYESLREKMVKAQLEARGISNPVVLEAFRKVPRHKFIGKFSASEAYEDHPVPIGEGQTISQPYIVALMTEMLEPQHTDKVLEIGTGSGYQAAILAEVTGEVFTIENHPRLSNRAKSLLESLDYTNINYRIGDGFFGWEEEAPFDKIIITAAPKATPPPLLEQLKAGGKFILPRGTWSQELILIDKIDNDNYKEKYITSVIFVPMMGQAETLKEQLN
ncbi:protein-L-isoaspartate(D-aspartate) O-methyltransferase [bacterium]|nr:protein-L-isoaspartate(D-aspartate) O-methyltransferase [bacterium]